MSSQLELWALMAKAHIIRMLLEKVSLFVQMAKIAIMKMCVRKNSYLFCQLKLFRPTIHTSTLRVKITV